MSRSVREIEVRRRRLDAVFSRSQRLQEMNDYAELQSDYARHLCVLVSGFVEKAIADLIVEYLRGKAPQQIQQYVSTSLKRFTNVNREKLLSTIGSLDNQWRNELDNYIDDQRKDALNSIISLRHDIAHGGGGSISLHQVGQYWVVIQEVVDRVEDLLLSNSHPLRGRKSRRMR